MPARLGLGSDAASLPLRPSSNLFAYAQLRRRPARLQQAPHVAHASAARARAFPAGFPARAQARPPRKCAHLQPVDAAASGLGCVRASAHPAPRPALRPPPLPRRFPATCAAASPTPHAVRPSARQMPACVPAPPRSAAVAVVTQAATNHRADAPALTGAGRRCAPRPRPSRR
eukprot:363399-Chlamydomonas_euryale.AAC.8